MYAVHAVYACMYMYVNMYRQKYICIQPRWIALSYVCTCVRTDVQYVKMYNTYNMFTRHDMLGMYNMYVHNGQYVRYMQYVGLYDRTLYLARCTWYLVPGT